nr:uncharacterized protein LOC131798866 isoform X2 [Pocillopora verrucosa]
MMCPSSKFLVGFTSLKHLDHHTVQVHNEAACLSSSAAATFTFDECKEAKKLGILLDSKDVQNNSDVTVPQQGTKKLDRARG